MKKIILEITGELEQIDCLMDLLYDSTEDLPEVKQLDPLRDRFFLEEIIFRGKDNFDEYEETLLYDWMQEMVENHPLTEGERSSYIKDVLGWDEEFCNSAYFSSEQHLKDTIYGR